ncbi:MAG: LPS export ABC transporter periplasmic protein LptC [Alphaproteobacteria bacterium]|nr:LPS export ABC transporter periplasmic protein LptC [Alphaproteobacteria bacterium]
MSAKARKDRYSRFVGTMKFLLPTVAASMMILLLLWPQVMNVEEGHFRVGFLSNLTLNTLENLTLVRAKYIGADREQRPYMVTAEMANQASPDSDKITLSVPAADITLKDGKWLALTAKSGEFRQHSQQLRLWGEVSIFHDDGYSFYTESARVDIKQGYAEGHDAVVGYGPAGSLKAEGFRVVDKGRRIIFTGKARLVINPNADDSVGSNIRKLAQ